MYYNFCPRLKVIYLNSYSELSIEKKKINTSYAIYSKKFYKNINFNLKKNMILFLKEEYAVKVMKIVNGFFHL